MPDAARRAAAPTRACPCVYHYRGALVDRVGIGFLKQHEKAIDAEPLAGEIENVLNAPRITVGVTFDGDEKGAGRNHIAGKTAYLDILVGCVRTGRVQEDFID